MLLFWGEEERNNELLLVESHFVAGWSARVKICELLYYATGVEHGYFNMCRKYSLFSIAERKLSIIYIYANSKRMELFSI